MSALVLAVVVAAGLLAGWWLLRDPRALPAGPAPAAPSAATVSVVVPARDEEDSLPPLLDSLADLESPVREVVVVDDGSQDATAAVARSRGATVLAAGAPSPGWTGKAWACSVGAGATSGDLLLFLDADTRLAPGALSALLRLHGTTGGLVSVQPFHRTVRPHEQLSAYFNAVSVMAGGAFAGRAERHPVAYGPCLLTSRDDYAAAGGHGAVRGEILDDVQLAAAYRRAGRQVRCALGSELVGMRSYPAGLRQLVSGWTKNISSGAGAASALPVALTVLWLCVHHVVAVGALSAVVGLPSAWSDVAGVWWAVAWVGVALQLRRFLGLLGTFRWWTWALFPAPLLFFDAVFALSAVRTVVRRQVAWRGREVPLGRGPAGRGA